MKFFRRGTALFLSLIMVLLSFNLSVFTAFAADGKALINEASAAPGTAITLSYQETSGSDVKYVWYVDGKKIDCETSTYTPTQEDLEKFIKVEVYDDGALVAADERFCSKLPVVYLNTNSGLDITSKEDYVDATVKITGKDASAKAEYDGAAETKGHGNSTWVRYPKKSYKLKLDKKTDLFGMGKNKHWLLLANYIDESTMRNMSSTELAHIYGAQTNDAVWVDVILNGKSIGNYTLFEHTKIGSTRVDIFDWEDAAGEIAEAIAKKDDLSKNDEDAIGDMLEENLAWMTSGKFTYAGKEYVISDYYTELPSSVNGGYLMEIDVLFDEISEFYTDHGQPVMFKNPEFLNTNQTAFSTIKNYVQDFENALYSNSRYIVQKGEKISYTDLCDINSFVTYFLASETLISEYGYKSTYFSKDVDDVIKFGPVWDFDFSAGCVNPYGNYFGQLNYDYWSRNDLGNWFGVAMKDPYFAVLAQETFMSKLDELKNMVKDGGTLDTWYEYVKESALNNNSIWPYAKGFEEDFKVYKQWLTNRIDWMEKQFATESTALRSFGINLASDISLAPNGANKVGDIAYTVPSDSRYVDFTAAFDAGSGFKNYEYYVNGKPCGVLSANDVSFTVFAKDLNSDGKDNVITLRATDQYGNAKTACVVVRLTDDSVKKITFVNAESKSELTVQNGKSFTLPEVDTNSVIFGGWSDGKNTYEVGTVLIADADKTYTAVYTSCKDGIKHTFEEKDGKLVCSLCQKEKDIEKSLIRIDQCTFTVKSRYNNTYRCGPVSPGITVYCGDRVLKENVDYTLTCYNNINPGFAYYTVKGIESAGFTGEISKSYRIVQTEITRIGSKNIKFDKSTYEYTGKEITPKLSITYYSNPLVEGRDYILSYSNNINAGTATVTITGIGNFYSSRTVNFKIAKPASSLTAKLSNTSYTYDGKVKTPKVTVTDSSGKTLVKNTDYTLSSSSGRTNVGTYTVKVTFKGDYTGTKTLTFKIVPASIKGATLSTTTYSYDGKVKTPKVTVTDKSGKTLKKYTDYTLSSSSGRKSIGTYTVKVTLKGNYTGTKTLTFKIVPAPVKSVKAVRTGYNSIKLTWSKVSGVTGYKIYRATSKNGVYKGLKTLKGSSVLTYTDKSVKNGTTYYYKVKTYKTVGKTNYISVNDKITTGVKASVLKAKISKLTAGNKSATVAWNSVSGANGYELWMATSKNGTYKKVKTTDSKTRSYTQKKLKSGTAYYKVRAYRLNGKTKVYGLFSDVKSVKIK